MRAADLEQALLVLPFADALRLFGHVLAWLRDGSQARAFRNMCRKLLSHEQLASIHRRVCGKGPRPPCLNFPSVRKGELLMLRAAACRWS